MTLLVPALGLWPEKHIPNIRNSLPTCFNFLPEQGVGGLEGCIGLLVLQPVPFPSRSYMGGEGHGRLVYKYS